MKVRRLVALSTALAAAPTLALAAMPTAVSPGGLSQPAAVSVPCPTFTWSPGDGPVELVVYDLQLRSPGAHTLSATVRDRPPRIRQTLPSGVTSWSASGGSCLSPGVYAWAVRPVGGPPLDWSEALLLAIRRPKMGDAEAGEAVQGLGIGVGGRAVAEGAIGGSFAGGATAATSPAAPATPTDPGAVTIDGEGNVFAGAFVRLCPNGKSFYRDDDNDGFGDPLEEITACSALGYVANNADCDDTDDSINLEDSYSHCRDGVDNDCDTFIDCQDFSCDAFGGLEADNCSDGLDNDCDSYVDCDDFDCNPSGICG